ncbi:endonuclease [Polymorphobacter multimanifer]|uniref:S1/P1 nuclease n=1 Tax=Polymorphobacter multimanifer TaxID=1070431 RepID=UPI0016691587|nr:S1/P1 nuclease [Polymorphobacter multimanifer]GGI77535.1 endonuclease [Polymorphobacter multimanifer]
MRMLFALLIVLTPAPVLAWGGYAHRMTASIAMAALTPEARGEVRRIMAGAARVETPECELASIEDASVWPDCVRALGPRFAFSAPWHYQNINICRAFDIGTKCPDGKCVTAQIPVQLDILSDRRRSPKARAEALAYFVHFMGDMHQPLHVGEKDDLGGNRVLADYGAKDMPRMNLHRIWDSDLAERALTTPPAVAPVRQVAPPLGGDVATQVAGWAEESFAISRELAYPLLGGDAASCVVEAERDVRYRVDEAYIEKTSAAVRQQVQRAGLRTAALLNAALGQNIPDKQD